MFHFTFLLPELRAGVGENFRKPDFFLHELPKGAELETEAMSPERIMGACCCQFAIKIHG